MAHRQDAERLFRTILKERARIERERRSPEKPLAVVLHFDELDLLLCYYGRHFWSPVGSPDAFMGIPIRFQEELTADMDTARGECGGKWWRYRATWTPNVDFFLPKL